METEIVVVYKNFYYLQGQRYQKIENFRSGQNESFDAAFKAYHLAHPSNCEFQSMFLDKVFNQAKIEIVTAAVALTAGNNQRACLVYPVGEIEGMPGHLGTVKFMTPNPFIQDRKDKQKKFFAQDIRKVEFFK